MPQFNLEPLRSVLKELASQRGAPSDRSDLLPALHAAQSLYGYLPEPAAAEIARALRVPLADVHGVIEFYNMFYNQPTGRRILRVCTDPACALRGGDHNLQAALREAGVTEGEPTPDEAWSVERSPCLGLCNQAPAANLSLPPDPDDGQAHTGPRSLPLVQFQFHSLAETERAATGQVIDHIGGGPRLLTALCGRGRAASLAEYEAAGGMQALRYWIGKRRPPAELMAEIEQAALVGMGGAAFPTELKWRGAADAPGSPKYLVINADESEPGTFKDRILLEGDPCRTLEGAILGAYAIGAQQIYCYIRGEYPLAEQRVHAAVGELEQAGYLGQNIFGSGFGLAIELRSGAGAYICGEETALFESIEGKRGFPRIKPPFPTTHGLFGKPTVINNVETLVKAAFILNRGAQEYRKFGTEKSPSTKLFCLSGDVERPGLYEVPFGITLRELVYEQAGGIRDGELQAILLGGAAGAFATAEQLDVAMSFEDLRSAGLPLGSGVVMVFNQSRDLRRALAELARFFAHESCGKCYPCQLGTQRQLELLERAAAGESRAGDRAALEDVGWTMSDASLCGLGQTAANATLSALRLWPELIVEGGEKRETQSAQS